MLIGELSERTGTSERLLRYYERMGLLQPQRRANGYRAYEPAAEETVLRIRALLAAGLPTRTIRRLLPCTTTGAANTTNATDATDITDATDATVQPCPGVLASLREQLRSLDERSARLTTARRLLQQTITATERASAAFEHAAPADSL
ncbi:MerR family transcriptional regulator [Kitasatospora sp. NBC_01287]|uniref:MerR family transcriptional regulator n=1 Tax=Kitasatospora sp. NBC_01287 TaxID=2903573 RepID=UPI002254666B|nr:MerR family transcriptional regulator [Kitasatospora sp. NBC_01287]MCX4750252.1 MerR family transcriptional regulator [Kitasatospora sp. NBC_01287]